MRIVPNIQPRSVDFHGGTTVDHLITVAVPR